METIFGRRRPDSIAVEWSSKVLYVLEFKRTSDQRRNYRERGEARARAQHDVLVKSLEKVAGEAVGENGGWKIKLLIFVGGTCGSVHVQTLNNNLRELGVLESKRNTVRTWDLALCRSVNKIHSSSSSERDSCTSCLMHKTRSYAPTSHKGRVRGVRDGTGKGRGKKPFKE